MRFTGIGGTYGEDDAMDLQAVTLKVIPSSDCLVADATRELITLAGVLHLNVTQSCRWAAKDCKAVFAGVYGLLPTVYLVLVCHQV